MDVRFFSLEVGDIKQVGLGERSIRMPSVPFSFCILGRSQAPLHVDYERIRESMKPLEDRRVSRFPI
jgi:hypothetical protein